MRLGDTLPAFDDATSWLNERFDSTDAAGSPVLVHFWSSGCPLCHEGAREIARFRSRFAPFGLHVVAVYQRRSDVSAGDASIERDARDLMQIDYTCAIDRSGSLARWLE